MPRWIQRLTWPFAFDNKIQYTAKLGWSHWMAMTRIMRSLKGNMNLRFQLRRQDIVSMR
jgi:hypothetical protein